MDCIREPKPCRGHLVKLGKVAVESQRAQRAVGNDPRLLFWAVGVVGATVDDRFDQPKRQVISVGGARAFLEDPRPQAAGAAPAVGRGPAGMLETSAARTRKQ